MSFFTIFDTYFKQNPLLQESVCAYTRWRLRPRPRLSPEVWPKARGCRQRLSPFRRPSQLQIQPVCRVRYSWCRHFPCGVCSWHLTGLNHWPTTCQQRIWWMKTTNTCHLCHQLSGVMRIKISSQVCCAFLRENVKWMDNNSKVDV